MQPTYQPARAWFMTAMLFLLIAINFIDKVVLGLVAAPLMKELGLSPAQYGLLAGSFFFLFAVTGVAGGFLSNRLPTRWLLLVMALLWAVVQLPIAYGSSLGMLIACRVMLGAGEGPAQPIAIHACYKWFPDERRNLPVSVFQQGAVLGMVVAGIAVPWIDAKWGWRTNFIVLAALGLAWAILWLVAGREGPLDARATKSTDERNVADSGARISYRALLADRTVACIIALHFAAFLTLALVLTWLPAYLSEGLGYAPRRAGQLFAALLVASAPVGIVLSALSQRLMKRGVPSRIARGAFVCVCLAVGGMLLVATAVCDFGPIMKVVLIALAISTTPIIYSLGPAMVAQIVPPQQRGAALAIEYSVAWIAGIVAPPAVGWMIRAANNNVAAGFEQGLLLTGALLIVLGVGGLKILNPERSLERLARRLTA
ncbi:putative sulfoacetate transporter SauU [Paraburkholderia caffeinitolerans]|uniref:Putative sulfoacetate transporter SauU n=1 Tax=Paraburkholderia caffeinitolerans TaxID=1723730 RepID=A0A6J5FYU8_9BURK|nr:MULTISPECIES: MFS transporter [Paraburkholderia]CAB3787777.1 putative sulfoacetate transporter SauU [Paraburkholderia caffeinitolerans]